MEIIINTLSNVIFILLSFVSILYFIGFAKQSKAYKIFAIYLFAMFIIEWLLRVIVLFDWNDSTLFLFVYYFVFQFIILSLFYQTLLNFRWIFYVLVAGFLFFVFQYINDPEMYFRYNPIGVVVGQGVIVIYSLLYFYKLLSEKGEFVIVNSGIFFYLLTSMLIFASGNLVFNIKISTETILFLGKIIRVLYFIFLILIMIEWYRNYRDPKKISP